MRCFRELVPIWSSLNPDPSLSHSIISWLQSHSFVLFWQSLRGQLAQFTEEARAKISELQVKLIEQEYNIRQEVSQEFSEQLTEIEDKHMYTNTTYIIHVHGIINPFLHGSVHRSGVSWKNRLRSTRRCTRRGSSSYSSR